MIPEPGVVQMICRVCGRETDEGGGCVCATCGCEPLSMNILVQRDPCYGRRSSDKADIMARTVAWSEFERLKSQDKTPFEAFLAALEVYRLETLKNGLRKNGGNL